MSQYKNSSYLIILPANIRDGESNKNDMTHDELTKHLHAHSQKKTHTPTNIPNKQKIKQQREQGVIVWYVCIKL